MTERSTCDHYFDPYTMVCTSCGVNYQEHVSSIQKGKSIMSIPEPAFIKVTSETRDKVQSSNTVNAAFISRVREQGGKAIISQIGEEYDIWAIETKDEIDQLIEQAMGEKIAQAY